jgi:hypothetical protein
MIVVACVRGVPSRAQLQARPVESDLRATITNRSRTPTDPMPVHIAGRDTATPVSHRDEPQDTRGESGARNS